MPLDLKKTYLLLGSNLRDREQRLEAAIGLIQEQVGNVFAISAIYETAAWGKTDQPSFLNLALGVMTTLLPHELLTSVLGIEKLLGRIRHERWGARLIDIDIILYEDEIINEGAELQIPHPEMQNRKFVLQPLVEIAPDLIHPILKQNMTTLLAALNDPLAVTKR